MSKQVQHQSKPQPSMPSQRLQTASDRSASFTPATVHNPPPSKAMGLLSALDEKFPELASGVTNEVARAIGADKLKQHRRAIKGDEMSDNATRAGRQAYEDVGTRNASTKTGLKMVDFANTYEGDDAGYEAGIDAIVQEHYELHGTSAGAVDVITDMMEGFNEKSTLARFGQVQRMEQIAKYQRGVESYHTALTSLTDNNERATALLMVMNENDAMGVTSENGLKAYEQAAIDLSISNKDSTMFDYAREKGFLNSSPSMLKAEAQLKNRLNIDKARADNQTILDTEDTLVRGNFSQADSLEMISQMTDENGDAIYTQVEQMALYRSIQRQKESNRQDSEVVANLLNYDDDEVLDHMGRRKVDSSIAPISLVNMGKAQQQRIVGRMRESYEEDYNIAMAMADDAEERERLTVEHEFAVLTDLMDHGLIDHDLKATLGVVHQNLAGMEGSLLPDGMRAAFDSLQHLANHGPALLAHGDDKEIAMGYHFQRGLSENLNELQAAIQAQKIVAEGRYKPVNTDEAKEIAGTITDAIEAHFRHGFFNYGKPDDLPDSQLLALENEIGDRVNGLMHIMPVERAVEVASKGVMGGMHQLANGNVIGMPMKTVMNAMGMKNQGTTEAFISSLPEQMLANEGVGADFMQNGATSFPPEDWRPVIKNYRIHFEADGFPITKPIHLSDLGGFVKADVLLESEAEGESVREKLAVVRADKRRQTATGFFEEDAEGNKQLKQLTRENWRNY